jgi:hypothetical protein
VLYDFNDACNAIYYVLKVNECEFLLYALIDADYGNFHMFPFGLIVTIDKTTPAIKTKMFEATPYKKDVYDPDDMANILIGIANRVLPFLAMQDLLTVSTKTVN